ncbi:hypothetical protein O181_086863 [Austropuccinia psidii MF-1]|uniref:Uncharacterized protein n=1 Tax=Austropuccinia psidii MF-1 TaxID=1389203 RepID=A0A9Q3INL4_9BASI|nr:hypothetical protein [Austropuccinia psidii MF-1]
MGEGLTGETLAGLAVDGFGEGGGIEDGLVDRTGGEFLAIMGITLILNLLAAGWEVELLDQFPTELSTTSTSSLSSSSLPSESGLVWESAILLILFTTPFLLILRWEPLNWNKSAYHHLELDLQHCYIEPHPSAYNHSLIPDISITVNKENHHTYSRNTLKYHQGA